MSRCESWDSTVPTLLCHASSIFLAQVQNRSVTATGDNLGGTWYIRKLPSSIRSPRYASQLLSNYHHQAQNGLQRGASSVHLLIGMIWSWCCPVHASDADLSMCLFPAWTIESTDSDVCNEMDAMDFIVLSTFVVCCTIQLLCHMLIPHIFHWNYLPISLCHCWIRGTGQIRLLRVYRFFVGSIFRWWYTW